MSFLYSWQIKNIIDEYSACFIIVKLSNFAIERLAIRENR